MGVDVVAPFSVGEGSWGHIAAIQSVFMPALSGAGFPANSFLSVSKALLCNAP